MTKNKKEEIVAEGKLNEVIIIEEMRPNGTLRIRQDYQFCPTMTEQHTAHLSDINYLMEKYAPDELAAYIQARNEYRQEILGHDFSQEPSLQDGLNRVYEIKQKYESLDDDVKKHFKNALEFVKFVDNEANAERLVKLGLLKRKEVQEFQSTPTTTPEAKKENQTPNVSSTNS